MPETITCARCGQPMKRGEYLGAIHFNGALRIVPGGLLAVHRSKTRCQARPAGKEA